MPFRSCRGALAVVFFTIASVPAFAQEDLEPRIVASAGQTTVGFSGFIDKFSSSEASFPLHATLHLEVSRFVTNRIALRGGVIGSAVIGGDEGDEVVTGPGATAVDALGSVLYYFTPTSMVSFYAGTEYRMPVSRRAAREAGTALGLAGLQATVSSRAAIFVQGGYGARLTRGDDGEWQRRLAAAIGFRLRF
jgi:hypothetical protein